MPTRKTRGSAARTPAASARESAGKKPAGKAPAKRPAGTKRTVKGAAPRPPAAAGKRGHAAGAGRAARRSEKTRAAKAAVRGAGASAEVQERLRLLQQEKSEMQDLFRQARAELDSALAEAAQLRERLRARDSEEARGPSRQEEPAGPGEYDPTVDLEDELPGMAEEDLEGAAGFFDRMDEIRARRNELDRERNDRELEQSEQSFWMICPKCGDLMEEQESENVKIERCENCGGLYMDRGEVDLVLTLSSGAEGLRRLHNVLKF